MTEHQTVGQEAEHIINGPRRDAYGPVTESFQRIADMWSALLDITITTEQVALMMVLLKVCREGGGNHHRDNLVDIIGYTLLLERLIDEQELVVAEDADPDLEAGEQCRSFAPPKNYCDLPKGHTGPHRRHYVGGLTAWGGPWREGPADAGS